MQAFGPVQVNPQVPPAHRTLPAHALGPVHAMALASASVVTPWPHDDAPEQLTLQLALVHVTDPLQALVPHFTSQLAPPQVTALHELVALQSMVHALAALQSMAPQPLTPQVTAQGIPGGQVTPPLQPPLGVEQSKTQVPPLHTPPLPHVPVHALASGAADPESAREASSPFAASWAPPSGRATSTTSSSAASRSASGGASSIVASLSVPAAPSATR
jgi:hypothetical protein